MTANTTKLLIQSNRDAIHNHNIVQCGVYFNNMHLRKTTNQQYATSMNIPFI